jgi:hypothetical protein
LITVGDAAAQEPAAKPKQTTPQTATPQRQPADEPEIKLPTGPMRVEPWATSETRNRYESDPPPKPPESKLILRAKLTGKRLVDMVGRGDLIVEEMVDDTGAVLKTLADYTERELSKTHSLKAGKRMRTAGYAGLSVDAPAASREARKLVKVRGYVNVVFATEVEEIMIDNPLQYVGGYLAHPRLDELGIKITVIEPPQAVRDLRETSGISLQFEGDARKHLAKAELFDAWLKPMYARERPAQTPDGEEFLFLAVVVGKVNADTQLLVKFYPEIEEEKVQFEFKDLALP